MMTYFADLHTHTSASDGLASPRELARTFMEYDGLTLDEVLDALEPEAEFSAKLGLDNTQLTGLAKATRDVANHLRTVGKTDHNTLLGTEEMLDELRRLGARERGKRFIVGAEINASHEFQHIGYHSLHLLVYFQDARGFDLLARTEEEARDFMKALRDDHLDLFNRIIAGLNKSWLNEKRDRVNEHFKGQIPPITEEELKAQSKRRAAKSCDPSSIINTANQYVPLVQTDFAELLYARGIGQSPEKVTDDYFARNAVLYVPSTPNQLTVPTDEVLRELNRKNRRAKVRAEIGLAHPAGYVRAIARKIEGDGFYGRRGVGEAFNIVGSAIDTFARSGQIRFIETDYPGYRRKAASSTEQEMRQHLADLQNDREFTRISTLWARQKASELGILASGGSDTHSTEMTPRLGYGFGDLAFPDDKVDRLFQR
jgi:predicted metal-dependent phosphoesterase TrpH